MSLDKLEHKRSTIMNVDVAGYSSLMARDETATARALIAKMRWLVHVVETFGGRVVDAPGDNLMAEFALESAALHCALHVQRCQAAHRHEASSLPAMVLRIGIHTGEVFERRSCLYGHTVNVAARLQASAAEGGVLVSEATAERLPPSMASTTLHEHLVHELKNIPGVVGAFSARV